MGKGGSWEKEDFFVFKNRDGGGEGELRAIGEGIVALATLRGGMGCFFACKQSAQGKYCRSSPTHCHLSCKYQDRDFDVQVKPVPMRISLVQEYFCDGYNTSTLIFLFSSSCKCSFYKRVRSNGRVRHFSSLSPRSAISLLYHA